MSEYRHLDVCHIDEVAVVQFRIRRIIEDASIQEMGQELILVVEQNGRKNFLLNFATVDFLSSAALGKLITLNKKVKECSGKLKLCCVRPEIEAVFKMTKLDRMFEIRKDQAEALAAF